MTEKAPTIVDSRGQQIPPRGTAEFRRYMALNGPQPWTPWDAASRTSDEVALWNPGLLSADTERIPYRDRVVSRVRDLVRNDGWGSGAVMRMLDNVVGANLRPIFRPDYRFLRAMTGNKAFDAVWAHEFGRVADANYRAWANDPGKWCDIERGLTMPQIFYVAYRHEIVDGDSLAVNRYEPSRVSPGRARYGTAVQLVDPDRLSNQNNLWDQMLPDGTQIRGGVRLDRFGAAVGYYIREAHQNDWVTAAKSMKWAYIPREDDYGRPITVHNFTHDRASQHRGGMGILTPVLDRMKMLNKYDRVEVQSALVNALFAAYIESPFDPNMVADAMGNTVDVNAAQPGAYIQDMNSGLGFYQNLRGEFHDQKRMMLGDARIATLFPGEKINTISASHPHGNFEAFESAILRNFSAATGLSPQQISQNYADANYSSMRAAMIEAWKSFDRRRANFTIGFCHPVACAWLEESWDLDDYPLPNGVVPDFIEARHAYAWARWIGPARGWVDPVAEKQGAWLGLKMGVGSLEQLAAEQGEDLEEILDAQQMEKRMYEDRKLAPPDWLGGEPTPIPSPPTVATKATPQGQGPDAPPKPAKEPAK
jgi:lambda family phage portal protein